MSEDELVGLGKEKQKQLQCCINDFLVWLRTKMEASAADKYEVFDYPIPTEEDWIMKVEDERDVKVSFNTYITGKCSFDYYRLIVLHECFHLFVQDLPNKLDAKRLRDDFGSVMMKLLDIEADYYTALFYKEVIGAGLVDIYCLNYEGSKIFGDTKIRLTKLERFIGSIISIANAYFKYPDHKEKVIEKELFLPNVSNIPMDDTIHVLMTRNSHFMITEINADYHDLIELKKCYTRADKMEQKDYVRSVLGFACKALEKQLPEPIKDQVFALRVS